MGIAEILALILKWTPLIADGVPGAIAEVEKLVGIVTNLVKGFNKKPTAEQIALVRASSDALTAAINATK